MTLTPERLAEIRADLARPKDERGAFYGYINEAEVLELLDELERLNGLVSEWLCEACRTVYPGPPQPGLLCVMCPKCSGRTGPREWIELERLRGIVRDLAKREPVVETSDYDESGWRCGACGAAIGSREGDYNTNTRDYRDGKVPFPHAANCPWRRAHQNG